MGKDYPNLFEAHGMVDDGDDQLRADGEVAFDDQGEPTRPEMFPPSQVAQPVARSPEMSMMSQTPLPDPPPAVDPTSRKHRPISDFFHKDYRGVKTRGLFAWQSTDMNYRNGKDGVPELRKSVSTTALVAGLAVVVIAVTIREEVFKAIEEAARPQEISFQDERPLDHKEPSMMVMRDEQNAPIMYDVQREESENAGGLVAEIRGTAEKKKNVNKVVPAALAHISVKLWKQKVITAYQEVSAKIGGIGVEISARLAALEIPVIPENIIVASADATVGVADAAVEPQKNSDTAALFQIRDILKHVDWKQGIHHDLVAGTVIVDTKHGRFAGAILDARTMLVTPEVATSAQDIMVIKDGEPYKVRANGIQKVA